MLYPYSLEKRVNALLVIVKWGFSIFAFLGIVLGITIAFRINSISSELDALKTPKNEVYEHNTDILSTTEWLSQQSRLPVNDKIALDFMQQVGMEHPHIVLAQMKLESGNYTSKLALENNNYFGMKQPQRRLTTSLGEKNGYASYQSWVYSVLDYALWQREYASGLAEIEYLDSLTAYAEDNNYREKIQHIANKIKNWKLVICQN